MNWCNSLGLSKVSLLYCIGRLPTFVSVLSIDVTRTYYDFSPLAYQLLAFIWTKLCTIRNSFSRDPDRGYRTFFLIVFSFSNFLPSVVSRVCNFESFWKGAVRLSNLMSRLNGNWTVDKWIMAVACSLYVTSFESSHELFCAWLELCRPFSYSD